MIIRVPGLENVNDHQVPKMSLQCRKGRNSEGDQECFQEYLAISWGRRVDVAVAVNQSSLVPFLNLSNVAVMISGGIFNHCIARRKSGRRSERSTLPKSCFGHGFAGTSVEVLLNDRRL